MQRLANIMKELRSVMFGLKVLAQRHIRAYAPALTVGLIVLFASLPRDSFSQEFPQSLSSQSIDRLHRLSPKFFSGSQPKDAAAFRKLKHLGVKTILSVDGTKPDVEAARKQGLRYVHLPIGYDGIAPERLMQIVKAAQTLEGPVFVHCHHGRHRGPVAAAICCLTVEKWDSKMALDWLQEAETSPQYTGLYRVVREFQMPSPRDLAQVPAKFPETAPLSTTVEAMVAIDLCWEQLKQLQKHNFHPSPDHPDVVPDQAALQLAEHFRELIRNDNSKQRGRAFLRQLSATNETAKALRTHLTALKMNRTESSIEKSKMLLRRLESNCMQCHAAFRDRE